MIAVALVLLVVGFFVTGSQGTLMIGVGLLLGALAGLELAIREHLAGFRSHTLLLSAVPAAIVLAILLLLSPDGLPPAVRIGVSVIVLAAAMYGWTRVFRARSGGLGMRVRGFTSRGR